MSSRFLLLLTGSVPILALLIGSCGGSDSAAAAMSSSGGASACNTPGCLGPADAAPDQVLGDVGQPPIVIIEDPSPLLHYCGEGCGTADDGAVFYPGNLEACGSLAAGGAGGELSCAVERGEDDAPVSACLPAGTVEMGSSCNEVSRCALGLACVGEDNATQCLPYCCEDPEACAPGTFCSAQPLRQPDDVTAEPLLVPVCVDAHDCDLDEPFPCPEDETCTCPAGLACTLVRDGTTGCVPPGTGTEGESCPCAPASATSLGYVCSQATQTCVKVCSPGASPSGCGTGSRCQATAAMVDNFGVCTSSYTPDAG
jgi:hypothetical protein